ncbi:hypothetical protein A2372_00240 [Candidatus Wolfebacteria bacterium RIFOXYB1_FULL_54_12]|uniref:Uncharacterized protein n=1 Tax=Candidatus Wolfebacteria bacterium RIFOXYB1_FULL_54_12 TaxID=1802559 RepID=A0A1F8DV16_9BACT|nr:MAG: hypothetical protein A2372_00240 [Candidatus Wolfebacteria bacterium RIFOXYB1_FULL_54_12]
MKKKNIALMIGAVALAAGLGAGYVFVYQPAKENNRLIKAVADLNGTGNYADAQKLLLEKMEATDAPDIRLMLANSYLDEGSVRGKEAEASKKAQAILFEVEKQYQGVYLYDLLGYSYEIVNDFDKALEYYGKALAIDGKSVNTIFSIGHVHWLRGENETALTHYRKAEQSMDGKTDVSVRAKVYAGLGMLTNNLSEAETYFLKAIDAYEGGAFRSEMYANLSNLKLVVSDDEKAWEYAKLAVDADPSSEMAYLAFVKSAMAQEDRLRAEWENVRANLFRAILLAPVKAEPQYLQGKFEFISGDYVQAIRSFNVALSLLDGDNSLNAAGRNTLRGDIYLDMATGYYLLKDTENAKKYVDEAIRTNPIKIAYILQGEQFKDIYSLIKN